MLLKIIYMLACRVPGAAVLVFGGDRAKDAELLVLRHQNTVLRRHTGQVRYEPAGCGSPRWHDCSPAELDQNLPRDASNAAGLALQAGREEVPCAAGWASS